MGLETVEIIMEIEEEFDLSISDEDADELQRQGRLGDFHRYVVEVLRRRDGAAVDSAEIWDRLRALFANRLTVPSDRLTPETHIFHDLHMD